MSVYQHLVGDPVDPKFLRGLDETRPIDYRDGSPSLHLRCGRRVHAKRSRDRTRPSERIEDFRYGLHGGKMYTERVDHVNMIYVNTKCDSPPMKEDMGERLRSARVLAGFRSARSAAIKFGWTPSTYAAHENGQNEFDPERAAVYGKAFKVSPGWLLTGQESGPASRSQPASESTVEELPAGDAFTFAKVDGSVQAGAFLAVEAFDDDLGEMISAPRDRRFPFARQVAYRVKGDSMNQAKPKPMDDGDYIVCALWEDLGLKEKDGLNVVVQQTTADGQLRERSVKEMRVFPDRTEFHPRSSNPAYKPIIVNREYHTDDGKEVTILALVRWVFDNQELPV